MHDTVDVSAVLDTATGNVISKLSAPHRAVDLRDFHGESDGRTEPGLAVHVICGNPLRPQGARGAHMVAQFIHQLAADRLTYRHRRWPTCTASQA
ncbi:hypothetical protein OG735_40020 [Streptomyces sp. NBC_01210]|uniref:hypothetical protein n=1 Tax=Streptomyces sp. NBC_01210 TaxID=2903774 RepID=UPI002E1368C8|nr:hypothetical protein OG735_40020 [Streptomyces sp. NBC_01210]